MKDLFTPNRAWNAQGPYIPAWFVKALKRIDKHLVVQYIPPRSQENPRGVNPQLYPNGSVDLCKRLPRSGLLHPVIVYSLTDARGQYQPPTYDTLFLIRKAYGYYKHGEYTRLEEEMDRAFADIHKAQQTRKGNDLHNAMQKVCSIRGKRQWHNKVFLRKEIPKGELCEA